jgi:hypothetical protein
LKVFFELGEAVEHAWRNRNYDELAFPDLASEALVACGALASRPEDVARWVGSGNLPRQIRLDSTFGEPPVTCFSNENFYIELLFWLDGTTSIHQHGFSGAFKVLAGSSIHTEYQFSCRDRVSSRLMLGDMQSLGSELLQQGDVRPIRAGDGFIHSLFHLDRPSMTVVVRTYQDIGRAPQYDYVPPCVARDPFVYPPDERMSLLLRAYETLALVQSPDRLVLMEQYLDTADLHSAFVVLERQFLSRPMEKGELDRLIAVLARRHGDRAEAFRAVFAEKRRQMYIVQRRVSVRSAGHRFFMSLLLNGVDRRSILSFIGKRLSTDAPVDQILQWLAEISEIELQGEQAPNPLGFEFREAELMLFRALLEHRSIADAVGALQAAYEMSPEDSELLVRTAETFCRSALFRPLLGDLQTEEAPAHRGNRPSHWTQAG